MSTKRVYLIQLSWRGVVRNPGSGPGRDGSVGRVNYLHANRFSGIRGSSRPGQREVGAAADPVEGDLSSSRMRSRAVASPWRGLSSEVRRGQRVIRIRAVREPPPASSLAQ